ERERSRLHTQHLASQLFLSIFIALLGFIVLKQINRLFNRADHLLDERRETLKPVSLLSEQLISTQTLGTLLAFSLAVGRILAYLVVAISTVLAIFSQFAFTRSLMRRFFSDLAVQMFKSLQLLLQFIPGLLLALVLLVGLQAALKILDLFLK